MEYKIKERLKKYPYIVKLLRRIYRTPKSSLYSEGIKNNILNNLKHNDSIFFVQIGSNDGMQGIH